jgi:hypothetical protein
MDPANARAKSRSRLGLTRELQQVRTDNDHNPGIGGTRGYPTWSRARALACAAVEGNEVAAQRYGCCEKSIRNWQTRIEPY